MAFVVKDLMIYLIRAQGLGRGFGGGPQGEFPPCPECTHCSGCSVGCSHPCSGGRCSTACTTLSTDFGSDVFDPPDLEILKRRLQIALAEVEARQKAVEESMRPRTIEEIELLERTLQGALTELEQMKKQHLKGGATKKE